MGIITPARFSIVVAMESTQQGIGIQNQLPWHYSDDLAYFKRLTQTAPHGKQNAIIMGRKTWESLPKRPLPNRLNIVVSTQLTNTNILVAKSLEHALGLASIEKAYRTFVIGGALLYQVAIDHHRLDDIYITRILSPHTVDCFFPKLPPRFRCQQLSTPTPHLQFEVWRG